MAKKIKDITVAIATKYGKDYRDSQKWSNDDVEYISTKLIKRYTKYNPIVRIDLLTLGTYGSLFFRIHYISRDSSSTRSKNLQSIREQLIMECV